MRKGEKGTTIIYYTNWENENEQGEKEIIPMLKSFTVFNVEQIEVIRSGTFGHLAK